MTAPDLSAIRARLQAGTPGPWERHGTLILSAMTSRGTQARIVDCEYDDVSYDDNIANAALIANAPSDLAALLEENERLHERLEDNHVFLRNADGEMVREDVAPGSIPDGIECRDATIKLQDEQIGRLRAQIAALTAAAEGARAGAIEEAAALADAAVARHEAHRTEAERLRAPWAAATASGAFSAASFLATAIRRLAAPATGDANG